MSVHERTSRETELDRPVRLVDIAAKAGVSRSAVASVVLKSAGKNVRVSDETAKRIREVARELGYRPNASAQRLAGKQSKIIGVLIDSYAPAPSYRQLAEMERRADESGYRVMIGQSHGEVRKIQAYTGDFIANGVDGALCISHDYPDVGRRIARIVMEIPNVVFLGRPLGHADKACWVAADHREGTRVLTEHLIRSGRRHIALCIPSEAWQSISERKAGYLDAIHQSDVGPLDDQVYTWESVVWDWRQSIESGGATERLRAMLDERPIDAILATNDVMAMHMVRSLHELGRRVPEDVAVAGYDNLPLTDITYPSITTIDLRDREMARTGVEMLLAMIEGRPMPKSQRHCVVTPKLIVRESS